MKNKKIPVRTVPRSKTQILETGEQILSELSFANKAFDAINLGNILHHKLFKSKIPPYY